VQGEYTDVDNACDTSCCGPHGQRCVRCQARSILTRLKPEDTQYPVGIVAVDATSEALDLLDGELPKLGGA